MIAIARNLRRPFAQRRYVSSGRSVRLTYGINDLCAEIAGLTVAETELAFHDILNLGAEAEAYVNGNRARNIAAVW